MKSLPDIFESRAEPSEYWKRLKCGDPEAFECLYRCYFSELYRYGMTLLPNESIIKDSIQQLFEDLWKYKGNLSEVDRPILYLLKCLRNILFKNIRESKMYSDTCSTKMENYEALPSGESLIIKSDQERDQKKELKLLINKLPPRQREAIMLIFFEGHSYEEVSSILSMSVQSVYTLVWRSLSSLRKEYSHHIC